MKQAPVLTERDMKRVLQNVTRWKEGRNSYGRYSILKGTIQRYLIPYFGNKEITLI